MGKNHNPRRARDHWHAPFFEALQIELDENGNTLEFNPEYQLNAEPLRIDVVAIKKNKDTPTPNPIAAIFQAHNIVEYKGPGDYISIADFYKVFGYACIYAAFNHIPIADLSVSIVGHRLPAPF
jgi:hypothetical protein